MQFHQKRGVQIYIRQKYTTLQKNFLTFNNQLQKLQLLPKISTKSVATVVFARKMS